MRSCFYALMGMCIALSPVFAQNLTDDPEAVPQYGVFEITLNAAPGERNPFFDVELQVRFTRPDQTVAVTDGFYDGGEAFKARAYCNQTGEWKWRTVSNLDALNGRSGSFKVARSSLKGKLKKHPDDPRQFAYDNGEWFLHIGDTGYRYVTDTEPEWQAYIDQAAEAGFSKIRTWFCRGRGDVQALFTESRDGMDLPYWREIDRRMTYALNHHPGVIFQLIPYGEDSEELIRYGEGDRASIFAARYAQARFSAFPNVYWAVSNDRLIVHGRFEHNYDASWYTIDRIGRDMKNREPWGTLITNHQRRHDGYSFVDEPWSGIITLEDQDQVTGAIVLQYWRMGDDPVVLDEDRYELYIPPAHPMYFFRRLMWANLLSGGSATYGGLRTYEAYDGKERGVRGYYDAIKEGTLKGGARDLPAIRKFFTDSGLTLVGMTPCDEMAGYDPQSFKCIRDDKHIIVYAANPDSRTPEKADALNEPAEIEIHLTWGEYNVHWFHPVTGEWTAAENVIGGHDRKLKAPFPGDAVLMLSRI
ncbi:MAG: DUF5060 domain-containing protein [bacterium]|nr:DUF5060 domain-containing protein [bacterium]